MAFERITKHICIEANRGPKGTARVSATCPGSIRDSKADGSPTHRPFDRESDARELKGIA